MIAHLVHFDDLASIRIVWYEQTWNVVAKDIVRLCGYEYVEGTLERYCDKQRSSCLVDTFRGKIMMDTVNLVGAQSLVANSPLEELDREQVKSWFTLFISAILKEPVGDDGSPGYWDMESIRLMYLKKQDERFGVPGDYWRDYPSQEEIDALSQSRDADSKDQEQEEKTYD